MQQSKFEKRKNNQLPILSLIMEKLIRTIKKFKYISLKFEMHFIENYKNLTL